MCEQVGADGQARLLSCQLYAIGLTHDYGVQAEAKSPAAGNEQVIRPLCCQRQLSKHSVPGSAGLVVLLQAWFCQLLDIASMPILAITHIFSRGLALRIPWHSASNVAIQARSHSPATPKLPLSSSPPTLKQRLR